MITYTVPQQPPPPPGYQPSSPGYLSVPGQPGYGDPSLAMAPPPSYMEASELSHDLCTSNGWKYSPLIAYFIKFAITSCFSTFVFVFQLILQLHSLMDTRCTRLTPPALCMHHHHIQTSLHSIPTTPPSAPTCKPLLLLDGNGT